MRNFRVYKLYFDRVHFGAGSLEGSDIRFLADTFASALYQEALKIGGQLLLDEFHGLLTRGDILFSDSFPFIGEDYLLPKPIVSVRSETNEKVADQAQKKLSKHIKYVPTKSYLEFLRGAADLQEIVSLQDSIGAFESESRVSKHNGDVDPSPYRVGVFSFAEEAGLWILVNATNEGYELFNVLLGSLSSGGIGGNRSRGLGGVNVVETELDSFLSGAIRETGPADTPQELQKSLLLTTAFPAENEIAAAVNNATYQLVKRSGFVASRDYADSMVRKKDIYKFQSGSVFMKRFHGEIFDVGGSGNHPVWSYSKAMWINI